MNKMPGITSNKAFVVMVNKLKKSCYHRWQR